MGLLNQDSIASLVKGLQPDECYHLAATHYSSQAHLDRSLNATRKIYTDNVLSVCHLLNAFAEISPHTHLVLAGSCAKYSSAQEPP